MVVSVKQDTVFTWHHWQREMVEGGSRFFLG